MSHPSYAARLAPSAFVGVLAASALILVPAQAARASSPAHASDDGGGRSDAPTSINHLARTPYQGWNTYYGLGSSFDAQTIKDEADTIVDRGLKAAGYDYVWIDGGWWNGARSSDGAISVDPSQWPDGMKAVADYIHSRGLKAGIYTDAGKDGCGGAHQGSYGHYQQDVNTFAGWGYDAVKVDFCGGENMGLDPATQYGQFRDALLHNVSGRPMLLNICNPFVPETGAAPGRSAYDSWKFGPTTGNSWRTDTDIGFVGSVQYADFLRNLDDDAKHPEAAGPGHWNDPDYLAPELGFTSTEAHAQFSMWSMLAAPLIVGSDVRSLSDDSIKMLENKDVLAIDQDTLGKQGRLLSQQGDAQVWVKPLANGDRAVALFNRGENAATVSTTATAAGLRHAVAYSVRNLWSHTVTESGGTLSAAVPAHGVVLYRVSASSPLAIASVPEVTLSPVTTPAAYPGSDLRLAVPGKPMTVSSAIQNDGRLPIMSSSVRLDVPAGWTVEPTASTRLGVIPGGRREQLSWTVTPPVDAAAGSATLTATAAYVWGLTKHETIASDTAVQVPSPVPSEDTNLARATWLRATSGWMTPQVDGAVGGGPLRIDGITYPTGIGVASPSVIEYYTGGRCSLVTGTVGIDDAADFDTAGGTTSFQVLGDGKVLYDSGVVSRPGSRAFSVPVTGSTVLTLRVGDGGDGGYNDRADWIDVHADCAS